MRRSRNYFGGLASRRYEPTEEHARRQHVEREHAAGHEPGTRPDACGRCREDVKHMKEET